MTYFEAKGNRQFLIVFRSKLGAYFSELEKSFEGPGVFGDPIYKESKTLTAMRTEINRLIPFVHSATSSVGQSVSIYYSPPPAVGGLAGSVDIFTNLGEKHDFGLTDEMYFDTIDQAIGKYDLLLPRLQKQLFNPFYWIFERVVFRFIRYIIELLGFNYSKIENSVTDKIIKLVTFITTILGLIKVVLELIRQAS